MPIKYRTNYRVPKPSPRLEQEQILPTLYLKEGTKIELAEDPEYLYLLHPEHNYSQTIFPLNATRAILALEPVEIEGIVLTKLMRSQIPVIIFSAGGQLLGRIEPSYNSRADLIQAQALMTDIQKIHLSQGTVWGILRRSRRFLMRSIREKNIEADLAHIDLQTCIDAVYQQDSIESLQGLLGRGMLLHYQSLPLRLNNDWQFRNRNDNSPLNRMLDFAYKLLEESAKTAIYACGLNPAIGYWHQSYRTQEGLVKDLSSEFKILCDAVVVRILNKGQVVPKDFNDSWETKGLPAIAVRAIANSFERKMGEKITYPHTNLKCTYQELLYLQAKQIAWYLLGEIDEYYSPDLK